MKKYLLLLPIVVLFFILVFLNYSLKYLDNISYTFVYDTNVDSIQRFSRKMDEISSLKSTKDAYVKYYNDILQLYCKILGEKKGVITFLMGRDGKIYHSSNHDKDYLAAILQDDKNMELINTAFASRSNGEITPKYKDSKEIMYYHPFRNESNEYSLFMCVDKKVVEADLRAYGINIPISIIGLLLFIMMEYTIWLKLVNTHHEDKYNREED